MAGGKITRIVASVNRIECDSWNVYTDEFNASSGGKSVFTADEGTHFGTPKELPPARKYFVKGWWTDKNDKPIKEAHIGDTIRFHIETKGIGDGEKVVFTVYDWDFLDILNDKLTLSDRGSGKEITTITIHNNKGFIEWTTGEQCLKLLDEILEGDEIELFVECRYKDETINLPYMESDYLILKEKEEIITVLIELPHSSYTDKLNRKGLGGHTGIIIGEEYYDYGHQANQGENLYSEGRPWWDKMNQVGNLTKKDIINILNREFPTQQEIDDFIKYYKNTGRLRNFPTTNRYSLGIIGRVCLIDIHIKGSEKNRIQKWWEDKYQNLGHYSVWILFGEQCTTTVRISIEESTEVFSTFDITSTTQSPQGFLGLLTEDGEHTYSSKKGNKLTINKEYREIPYIEISNFESGYNQQLSS